MFTFEPGKILIILLYVNFYISFLQRGIFNFPEKLYKLVVSWNFSLILQTDSCNSYFVETHE